jgi:hypothetical protein
VLLIGCKDVSRKLVEVEMNKQSKTETILESVESNILMPILLVEHAFLK